MMRCENCSHECTVLDFVTLRNLCEHLYLDALAQKQHLFSDSATIPMYRGREYHDLFSREVEFSGVRGELQPLER